MTIKLYNTRTRSKEDFDPIDRDDVRMYVCGPTVYDRAHLGNARPVVVFDVLYRLLRHTYGADHVTYVRNFTDVDDKINKRAAESGREIGEITAETTQWFLDDMAALGALEPDHMPRATQYIPQMITMIGDLIEKGFAYSVRTESNDPPEEYVIADREALLGEHALFEVERFERYGELSGQSTDEMIAGARGETAPGKRSPMDFVLWKPSTPDLPGWDSPWGRGRPGWHIECSAMSKALLGDTFDIHGGGRDLMFPHHENEIAQSCCANGTDEMARYWMHNEMLQVEGKKMSKSLGNFFTVRDLLEGNWSGGWKVPGEVIRFVLLSTHYRKPMDWTEKKAGDARRTLQKWYDLTDGVEPDPQGWWAIRNPLQNDLDTSGALQKMHELARDDIRLPSRLPELRYAMEWMGFPFEAGNTPPKHFRRYSSSSENEGYTVNLSWTGTMESKDQQRLSELGHRLFNTRRVAIETKDFTEVDLIKSTLDDAGVEVRVSKDKVELEPGPGFDPSKLESLK
ncbi:cysteine--tRNA ligase [Rhodobacteraceae bacterium F11138]|nr:cysteine--tRNA ligase [Rhodobacteraceae bacterium F11138]